MQYIFFPLLEDHGIRYVGSVSFCIHHEEIWRMAPPITIKKRSVTLKSRPTVAAKPAETEEPTEASDAEEAGDAPVFLSKPTPTGGKGASAPSTATAVAAILAVIATLIFLFIILIQWTELREVLQLFPQTLGFVSNLALHLW